MTSDDGQRAGLGEPVDQATFRPLGWPNGPWLLVAMGALALAITGWGWATLLPAEPRWLWLAGLGAAGASGGLGAAARRTRDGFGGRWPATTMGLLTLVALAGFVSLPVDEGVPFPVILMSLGALVLGIAGGLATVVIGAIRLLGRHGDGLLALGLIAVVIVGLNTFDSTAMRLQGPAGDHLAAEAEALSAGPSAEAAYGQASPSPFVVAGTGRRLVAWRIPRFDTETLLLVHDPDGLINLDDLPASVVWCGHVTGPWWNCTYG